MRNAHPCSRTCWQRMNYVSCWDLLQLVGYLGCICKGIVDWVAYNLYGRNVYTVLCIACIGVWAEETVACLFKIEYVVSIGVKNRVRTELNNEMNV